MARRTVLAAFGVVLSCCLLAGALAETSQRPSNRESSQAVKSRQKTSLAPIVHRRSSLPTGWFEKSTPPSSLTGIVARTVGESNPKESNARQAVHFNASGIDSNYQGRSSRRRGVASRLQAIRRSVILPDEELIPRKPKSLEDIGLPSPVTSVEDPQPSVEEIGGVASAESESEEPADESIPSIESLPSIMKRGGGTAASSDPQPIDGTHEAARSIVSETETKAARVPKLASKPDASAVEKVLPNPTIFESTAPTAEPSIPSESVAAPSTPSASSVEAPETKPTATGPSTSQVESLSASVQPESIPSSQPEPSSPSDATTVDENAVFVATKPESVESTSTSTENDEPGDIEGFRPMKLETSSDVGRTSETEAATDTVVDEDAWNLDSGSSTLGDDGGLSSSDRPAAARTDEDGDDVLFSNRSPSLAVKTRGPRTIKVGRVASYRVSMVNSSEHDAEDVVVTVNIPSWAELGGNQASAGVARLEPDAQGNSVVTWTIRHLPGQTDESLRLDVVPRSSQPFELGVSWTFSPESALTQIQVQEPKLQMSVVGPQDILFGETKIYTITVRNPGTGDAENVSLTLLPISDGSGTAGMRELGLIKAGSRRTIEVELTARQAGRLMVRAQATADGGLECQGQQDVLVRRANLEIEATGPAMKYAGTNARYAIRITNTGDATARDVVAAVALPMQATYAESTDGGVYDKSNGRVRWDVGALRPGAVRVLELSCVLMRAGSNRVEVRAKAADQVTAAGSAATEVESLADLKLMVNDPKGAVAVGSEMVYEVRIVNRGTKAARSIDVVGYFSEGIEPIAVRGWRADVEVGQVVFERISQLGPGQEMVVKIAAQAHRSGDHVFRTELESNDPETKLAVEEWTRFFGDDTTPLRQASRSRPAVPETLSPARLDVRR